MTSLLDSVKFATVADKFIQRMRNDAIMLTRFRTELRSSPASSIVPEGLLSCAHKLAGAAGIFNFGAVSALASALEEAILAEQDGRGTPGAIEANLIVLIEGIERE